mmetsp:Transcript_1692/g.5370  ORF Transcript_1692/g.5370 Transcript_1692/m.5370 type:complete len:176 (-) Transcript_1692:100-627(-)
MEDEDPAGAAQPGVTTAKQPVAGSAAKTTEAKGDSQTPQQQSAPETKPLEKKPPVQAASRAATPGVGSRPASQSSSRRHPDGGVAPHSRGNSRVSTPAPGMTRRLGERPSSTASQRQALVGSVIPPPARVRSANATSIPRTRGLPQLRVADTDDDVARDFLSSLVGNHSPSSEPM